MLCARTGGPLVTTETFRSESKTVPGVTSAAATTYDGAMLVGPGGAAYAVLRGLDKDSQQALNEVRDSVIEGSMDGNC